MTVVSAFLVPGLPLPQLRPDVPAWGALASAFSTAGEALAASRPDAVLVYSTQWFAVLDELWLTRARSTGLHVDENWYEYGEQSYDLVCDTGLAEACVAGATQRGIRSRGVDYDGFPIDTGTISAATLMNFGTSASPLVAAANNLYHDGDTTARLAAAAVECASEQGKRIAVVGVGGLSNVMFREEIDVMEDRIQDTEHDEWNQRLLKTIESAKADDVIAMLPEYGQHARPDMGMKHLHWVLGALGSRYSAAKVHGYGPMYGSGGAVVEFKP